MFFNIYELYKLNPKENQKVFNEVGRQIQDVIHTYEKMLCGKTEGGMYSKFSSGLSEKFWGLLRNDFPKIDCIGIQ